VLEYNKNYDNVDRRSFVCQNLHEEECYLIVQLKRTVCEYFIDQTNLDAKDPHHDCNNSGCSDIVSECLCPLRLFINQEKNQELRSHLDKLMDHNDDVTDLAVRKY